MTSKKAKPTSRTRSAIAVIGLTLGGLAPLVTGIIGMWGYLARGYFIAKGGERVDGPVGFLVSLIFILAGLGMIWYAIVEYRRKIRSMS